jgi:hypothetical protein
LTAIHSVTNRRNCNIEEVSRVDQVHVAEVLEAVHAVSAASHHHGKQVGTGLGTDLVVVKIPVLPFREILP